jgi:hypothetical protein
VSVSAGEPSGTVTFLDGATVLRSFTLSGGQATFTLSTLSVGTHRITARYNGSAVYATDTSPVVSQSVIRALTTTTLSSSANPSHLGSSDVHGEGDGGKRRLGDRHGDLQGRHLGTGYRNAQQRVATFATETLSAGAHTIYAVYGGSATHASSQRSLRQVVQ